jgi:hypothetical protein
VKREVEDRDRSFLVRWISCSPFPEEYFCKDEYLYRTEVTPSRRSCPVLVPDQRLFLALIGLAIFTSRPDHTYFDGRLAYVRSYGNTVAQIPGIFLSALVYRRGIEAQTICISKHVAVVTA